MAKKNKKSGANEVTLTESERSKVTASLSEYNNRKTVNIRQYFVPEGQTDFVPTRRGVNLPLEQYELLRDWIKDNDEHIVDFLTPDKK